MIFPKCPVCSSKNSNLELASRDHRNENSKPEYKYFRCGKCKSLFLESLNIKKNFYKKAYKKSYYSQGSGLKGTLETWYSTYTNSIKKGIIDEFASDKKVSIIDVGSGNLRFLQSLNEEKYSKYSIDINPTDSEGLDVKSIVGDFNKHNFAGQKFDMVTAWHVIEHIPEPTVFFQKLNFILNNKGIAVISTPLIDSLGYKIAKSKWYHLDAPRHIVLFNEKSLMDTSENFGFEILKVHKPIFEFPFDLLKSMIWSGKSYLLPLYPFMKLLDRETIFIALRKK